jgi:hypothetical protein
MFSPEAKAMNLVAGGGIEPPTQGFSNCLAYLLIAFDTTNTAVFTVGGVSKIIECRDLDSRV